MNIHKQNHKARLNELLMLLNLSDDILFTFKDVDEDYAKAESEKYLQSYGERLADFMKTTFNNAGVIGDFKI